MLTHSRTRYARPHPASPLSSRAPDDVPGVSVIRPLCGLDTNMYSTLESVMRLNYPKYEVIFALQDPRDEALPVVKMVMAKYPDVPASIVISESAHAREMWRLAAAGAGGRRVWEQLLELL